MQKKEKKIRLGLSGFGRIGRSIMRLAQDLPFVDIVAITDTADATTLSHLLKYDSIWGRFPHEVRLDGNILTAGAFSPQIFQITKTSKAPWQDLGVDVLLKAVGKSVTFEQAQSYIEQGIKRVVLTNAVADSRIPLVVGGANSQTLDSQRIVSFGSPALHAGLPIVQILQQNIGIERLFYTTVQAYDNQQNLADVPAPEAFRRSRAAASNIIPLDETSQYQFKQLLPTLAEKISGLSLRTPVSNGALIDIVAFLKMPATTTQINELLEQGAKGPFQHWLAINHDAIVSSDIRQSPYASTVDAQSTMSLGGQVVKILSWYDNTWGYSKRFLTSLQHLSQGGNP